MKKIILLLMVLISTPAFSLEAKDLYDSADGYLPCKELANQSVRSNPGNILGPTIDALPTYDQSKSGWPRGLETTWNDFYLCKYINNSVEFVLSTLLELVPTPVAEEGTHRLEPVGIESTIGWDGNFVSMGREITVDGEVFHEIVLKFKNPSSNPNNNNKYYFVTVLAKEGFGYQ